MPTWTCSRRGAATDRADAPLEVGDWKIVQIVTIPYSKTIEIETVRLLIVVSSIAVSPILRLVGSVFRPPPTLLEPSTPWAGMSRSSQVLPGRENKICRWACLTRGRRVNALRTPFISFGSGGTRQRCLLEPAIPRHERFEHVRDQRRGINRLAVGLSMQRGVAFQIGLQPGGERDGDFDGRGPGERPQPQLAGRYAHCDEPLWKNSGWYGRRIRSLFTMTRIGKPGRIVSVGWMLTLRLVIS